MPSVPFKKRLTIGVDIGHAYIKLAKVSQSDKHFELLDYLDVPINFQISLKDPKFLKILKSTLDQFSGQDTNCKIWSAIQSAKVETRFIRIPKLPRKQIPNAIFWTFTKKVPFNGNEEILDYEIIGDINEDGIKKTEVIVFKAPMEDVISLKGAFRQIGYPLTGISIVPFAIQNLFRANIVPHPEEDTCCLFVGRDWSRIAIFSRSNLILSRGIKAGMRSMVEAINIALQRDADWSDAPSSSVPDGEDGVEHATAVHPQAQRIFFRFVGITSATESHSSPADDLDPLQVFQMVLPAMERLIRQVERTFEHYALNFNSEGVRRIFISGQITANTTIIDYMRQQLDLPVIPLNPFPAGTPFVRQVRIPELVWQREGFVPAIGLALSNNKITPNFLFTHQDKDTSENVRRNNMRVLTCCLVILIFLIGIFSWQEKQLDEKRGQIEKLNNKLLKYNPPAQKELLLAMYAKTKHKRKTVTRIVHRYTPVAVLAELSQITPANIRLTKTMANFGKDNTEGAVSRLTIEGIVFGTPGSFETSLTGYMLSLKNSPMFNRPQVQNKKIEYYDDQEVLRFKANLEII